MPNPARTAEIRNAAFRAHARAGKAPRALLRPPIALGLRPCLQKPVKMDDGLRDGAAAAGRATCRNARNREDAVTSGPVRAQRCLLALAATFRLCTDLNEGWRHQNIG